MPIHSPQLKAKKGYVEVEVEGKRTYRNIKTLELIDCETEPSPDPEADRDAMLVDLEYRTTLLELGVN